MSVVEEITEKADLKKIGKPNKMSLLRPEVIKRQNIVTKHSVELNYNQIIRLVNITPKDTFVEINTAMIGQLLTDYWNKANDLNNDMNNFTYRPESVVAAEVATFLFSLSLKLRNMIKNNGDQGGFEGWMNGLGQGFFNMAPGLCDVIDGIGACKSSTKRYLFSNGTQVALQSALLARLIYDAKNTPQLPLVMNTAMNILQGPFVVNAIGGNYQFGAVTAEAWPISFRKIITQAFAQSTHVIGAGALPAQNESSIDYGGAGAVLIPVTSIPRTFSRTDFTALQGNAWVYNVRVRSLVIPPGGGNAQVMAFSMRTADVGYLEDSYNYMRHGIPDPAFCANPAPGAGGNWTIPVAGFKNGLSAVRAWLTRVNRQHSKLAEIRRDRRPVNGGDGCLEQIGCIDGKLVRNKYAKREDNFAEALIPLCLTYLDHGIRCTGTMKSAAMARGWPAYVDKITGWDQLVDYISRYNY